MGKKIVLVLFLISTVLFSGFAPASAALPSKIIGGVVSNAASALLRWIWSLVGSTTNAITGRPVMKYEEGYTVETVFDGSKLGIDPYAVEVAPSGELLVLDSDNSNIYKISPPLSRYSRPKLVAGSSQGYSGHVDGRPRDARLNHPKGFTVDDKGNIYIADTMNMAIRKISDAGVTTIAGGKWGRGGRFDGSSDEAKFSTDFDVVYVGSSCSLLVIDRGNQAIREIQLQYDDCAHQYGFGSYFGIAVILLAVFFGYMLAMMVHKGGTSVSSQNDLISRKQYLSPYQTPPRSSVRSTIMPLDNEQQKHEEGFPGSFGGLVLNTMTSMVGIVGGLFGFRKKPSVHQLQNHYYQQQKRHAWPLQDSFEIPDEDVPPSVEATTPTPKKTYAFMAQDPEKTHLVRQSKAHYSSRDGEFQQQRQQKQQQHRYQQQYISAPQTFYAQSCESTTEIVFGTVQKQGKQPEVKVAEGDHHNLRSRNQNVRNGFGY